MTEPRRTSLGTIFLTVFIDLVGFSIIFPLFPAMLEYYFSIEGSDSLLGRLLEFLRGIAGGEGAEADFRTQVLFGGFLGSLYSVLQFICAPLWGSYSDRVGRKKVLLITISGLAISYLAWFLSGSFLLLIFSRFFGGAMSGNISVASAAIADSTDAKNRTKGMALIGIAFGLGFICGPAIGGGLSYIDLREWIGGESIGVNPFSAPAAAALLLSIINLFWVTRRFQETLPPERRGDAKTKRPINPVKLFRTYEFPGVNRTNLSYFFFIVVFAGMEFTLTFLATDRFGYERKHLVGMFLFIGFMIAFTQGMLVRRLAPRIGEKKLALFGFVVLPVGLLTLGLSEASQAGLYIGLGLLAIGSGCLTPSMSGLVSRYTPPDRQGEIQGVFRSLGALGRAVGPIAACALYFQYGPLPLYVAGTAILALPFIIALTLPPPPASEGE